MDPSNQEMSDQSVKNILLTSNQDQDITQKPRPQQDQQPINCPRCDSTNTKFCYYNNYSLSQPRYFCKSCRRYWTKGGTLRNVPLGGGCRKNKWSSKRAISDHQLPHLTYDHNNSDDIDPFGQKSNIGFNHDHSQNNIEFFGLTQAQVGNNNPFTNEFLDTHNNFQNFYYGFDHNSNTGVNFNGEFIDQEQVHHNNENGKALLGFPWLQMNGGDHHGIGRSTALNNSSSWHGLINSPLM